MIKKIFISFCDRVDMFAVGITIAIMGLICPRITKSWLSRINRKNKHPSYGTNP
jgi:hypothetical protein